MYSPSRNPHVNWVFMRWWFDNHLAWVVNSVNLETWTLDGRNLPYNPRNPRGAVRWLK